MGVEAARSAAQRAAAAALVRAHLPALLPAVLRSLQDQGYLQPDQDPGNSHTNAFIIGTTLCVNVECN